MELKDYRKDYLEAVKTRAADEKEGTVSIFVKSFLEDLQALNIISDFEICFTIGSIGEKKYRVDGYCFDDYDNTMSLFIADYDGETDISQLSNIQVQTSFEKIEEFVDLCINGNLRNEVEISTPVYDLIESIITLSSEIRKYRLFLITDKVVKDTNFITKTKEINNIPIEYNIWDINRLYRVLKIGDGHEPVEINFKDLTQRGLPCLEASDVSNDSIQCLLCVIPGNTLADLYDKYGSTLLESNVRSFLSAKGKVNKDIRKTIIEADGETKSMFFSYNNGISATATSVELETINGVKNIISIKNLQIVNGGQTTASLSNTRFKDKADLSGIFVQMKLTVIPDHEQAQVLIPKISRGSNSQNKVTDADFFSNHDFNIRMQQISRRLYAPAVNGLQYETHWFFERSRGQYDECQSKLSDSDKKKFQMQNPKNQRITKTDFAKYQNAWNEYPYFVNLGAQKNFSKFANFIVDKWDSDDSIFNDTYFINTVVIAILYNCIDSTVANQSWYEKGYKANIVVYTLSFFHHLIKHNFSGSELNMRLIWNKQRVPDEIQEIFIELTKFVFEHITSDDRPIKNVTEWCKKEQCWILLKAKPFVLNEKIKPFIISKDEQKRIVAEGKKQHAIDNGIQVQSEVVQKGQEYWEDVLLWGKKKNLLSDVEISFLTAATKMNFGRIPTEKQCQRILNIAAKLIDEGFTRE